MLTSVANDYGFERVFARQIEALGRPATWRSRSRRAAGRRTSSRRSKRRQPGGLRTIALTGRDGGDAGRLADIHVNVPDDCHGARAGSPPHADPRDLRAV